MNLTDLHIKKMWLSLRLFSIFVMLAVLLLGSGARASAADCGKLSALDCKSLNGTWTNWVPNNGKSCSTDSSGLDATAGTDTPKWHTTIQPPYNLEDFVVEVLRDVAAKEGVPESSTVTDQHVLALVAFAYGEGGNLTNTDIYNPWNTGYSAPDLQPVGGHSTSGVQSYASFDDGVEATARVMTGTGGSSGYQTRLGQILKDPNTSAVDFMKALTYYQHYKNNLAWATASMPPNQSSYYQGRLDLIQTVQTNYKDIASSVIGPPGNSYTNNQHTVKPLRYSFGSGSSGSTGSSTDTSSSCSGGGAVQGNIVQTALNFAWTDYPSGHNFSSYGESEAKPEYVAAVKQYETDAGSNPAGFTTGYTDCGAFVATVMRASGVDPNYQQLGTSSQLAYVQAHSDKYTVLAPGSWKTSDVQPGDVFISDGHTYIYVGKQSNGYSVAEASQGDHVPEVDNQPYTSQFGSELFYLVRVK